MARIQIGLMMQFAALRQGDPIFKGRLSCRLSGSLNPGKVPTVSAKQPVEF